MANSTKNRIIYRFATFEVDPEGGELRKSGVRLRIQEQPLRLLVALLERPGTLILREELHSRLWPNGTFVDFDHGLNSAATRLRQVLGDTAQTPRFIEGVPRRGYRFVAPVERVDFNAEAATPPSSELGAIATPNGIPSTLGEVKPQVQSAAMLPSPQKWSRFGLPVWTVAISVLVGASILVLFRFRDRSPDRPVTFNLLPPEGTRFAEFDTLAVSPDGRTLSFTATSSSGDQYLWVRPLDREQPRRLDDTAGALFPFWSPDARTIGFFANGKLKRIDTFGGPPQTICDAPGGRGGSWNSSGIIVFAPASDSSLFQVPAGGGAPKLVTKLDPSRNELTHRWPFFLPDGHHFLYMVRSAKAENSGIYLGSLDSDRTTLLLRVQSNAVLTRSPRGDAYLLFGSGEALMSQRFDLRTYTPTGDAVQIADSLAHNPTNIEPLRAAFSASEQGVLAYVTGRPNDQLTWFERTGARAGALGEPGVHLVPTISPDDRAVIVETLDSRTGIFNLSRIDATHGKQSQITFNGLNSNSPVWSPDGAHVAFASLVRGTFNLYRKLATGAGNQESLFESSRWQFPTDWSPDGRYLLYFEVSPLKGRDIWALPLFGDRSPLPLVRSEHDAKDAKFSPDEKWFVYSSNESGKQEVYVQPFPPVADSGGKWKVSEGGGSHPQWPRPGNEIYYLAPDRRIMAVEVRASKTLEFDSPRPLFDSEIVNDFRTGFAVSTGGTRFLVPTAVSHESSPTATIVVNWMSPGEN